MAEPFMGEIRMAGFTFAPRKWAKCDGGLMYMRDHEVLYSVLGTQFGGDGVYTFGLPDLRGRVPVHPGHDVPRQGKQGGAELVTLSASELPRHTHPFMGTTSEGTKGRFSGKTYAKAIWKKTGKPANVYNDPTNLTQLNPDTCTGTGGSLGHENMQPSLVILFIIALDGVYPTRKERRQNNE